MAWKWSESLLIAAHVKALMLAIRLLQNQTRPLLLSILNMSSSLQSNLPGKWFSEVNESWPGHAFSLEIKEVIHQERSKYQDILIFDSEAYGRVLALDGIIQCTSRDEFSYQEMITHLPLFSHPCPKSVSNYIALKIINLLLPEHGVLVVGGGDGGVLREVAKHPTVEEIHICEIDERVIELSKQHLKHMSVGFDNPKVKVFIEDGQEFLCYNKDRFDVIISDTSDPTGPAVALFQKEYFNSVKNSLKSDGIMCLQGQCLWLKEDMKLIQQVMRSVRNLFPVTSYAYTTVPTYTTGQIGFVLASKNKDIVFETPTRSISDEEAEILGLRYYDSQVHRGAFILPRFAKLSIGLL